MSRHKGVILQDRILLLLGKALGERIHFLLELFGILNLSDLCIPSILGLAIGRGQLLPGSLGAFVCTSLTNFSTSSGIFKSGCVAASTRRCMRTSRRAGSCASMVQWVPRKIATFRAISAKVTTGQRRPSMFSWRNGMSIRQPLPIKSKRWRGIALRRV